MSDDYYGPGDYISLGISILLMVMTVVAVFMPLYLIHNKSMINDERFKTKFSEMYEGVKRERNNIIIYPSLYFFRRFAFLALVFVAENYSGLQVMGFLTLSVFNLVYLTYIDPYKSTKRFYIEVFNEVCHLFASYCLFGFTELNTNAS